MRRRRRGDERGAILVELAIVAPFLLVMVLGLIELGFRTHTSQTVVSASRAGARVASSAGDSRLADHDVLQAVAGALSDIDDADVIRIIVFKANAIDGEMTPGCRSGPVNNQCNHYDASDFTLGPAAFTTTTACDAGAPDRFWCPTDRIIDQLPGADWLGVEIQVQHQSSAGFLLGDTVISDRTIMRLEPRVGP